jgi:hypothetical protein
MTNMYGHLPIMARQCQPSITTADASRRAVRPADFISLTAFEIGLFGWMAIMAFVPFPAPHHLMLKFSCLLASHAGRHDHRLLHLLARKRLAGQTRHQSAHVSRPHVPAGSFRR